MSSLTSSLQAQAQSLSTRTQELQQRMSAVANHSATIDTWLRNATQERNAAMESADITPMEPSTVDHHQESISLLSSSDIRSDEIYQGSSAETRYAPNHQNAQRVNLHESHDNSDEDDYCDSNILEDLNPEEITSEGSGTLMNLPPSDSSSNPQPNASLEALGLAHTIR